MNISLKNGRAERALSFVPKGLRVEILRFCAKREGGISCLREIRVRCNARCSIMYKNEMIALVTRPTKKETEDMLALLCEGSLYAHRDNILNGFIPIGDGIRVGVCGFLSYENGRAVGASDISSFVFRIPTGECEFSEELFNIYLGVGFSGMLIYSPPGVGKTTALRSLARNIGSGRAARHVCVVDTRCEFSEDEYADAEVDILRGYSKKEGIEIACRTMSPDVIMVDEFGSGEACSLVGVVRCGVPVIATAHASCAADLYSRGEVSSLISAGAFDVLVGIKRDGGAYFLTVDRV